MIKPPAMAVKVKKLVWTQRPPPAHEFEPFVKWAAGVGGWYRIEPSGLLFFADDEFTWEQFGSQAEAQAAAQAHHERRIMEAIEVGDE